MFRIRKWTTRTLGGGAIFHWRLSFCGVPLLYYRTEL